MTCFQTPSAFPEKIAQRAPIGFWHYRNLPQMFDDYSLDPRSQLVLLCLFTAFVFWNTDSLFFLFATMAAFTRFVESLPRL